MKIGEALDYRCLTECGGKLLIEQGMEAWAAYVRTQRAFLVTWAIQEALALCRTLGVQEPELSGEEKRLVGGPKRPPSDKIAREGGRARPNCGWSPSSRLWASREPLLPLLPLSCVGL